MVDQMSWPQIKSEAIENYLKAIYQLNAEGIEASGQEIAARIGVSPPAASKMFRHLAKHHLVNHTPYQAVVLTELGKEIALEVIRHHRLLELYLVEALGYGWESVHMEAERLEHHISEDFEDTIDRLLGHPTLDPHGDPIPSRDGTIPRVVVDTLASQEDGACMVVRRVTDEDSQLLRYLAERDLRPGKHVHLIDREPFGGSLRIEVAGHESRISPEAARHVFVEPATQSDRIMNEHHGS
jgi:DtxR family transcriptional regulator, Mn-dependent transcriptional regulator